MDKTPIWRVSFEIPGDLASPFANALEPFVETLMWSVDEDVQDQQRMEGYSTVAPDTVALLQALIATAQENGVATPVLTSEYLKARDWLSENLKDFPPINEGRFFIHASHIEERPLPGRLVMRIDPGTAFGTGTHATTSGCLMALEELGKKYTIKKPLDMGSGSGILSIAMAKLWHVHVVGVDIDPQARCVAHRNARLNATAKLLSFHTGKGFLRLPKHARYDMIVANILARPLRSMAVNLVRHLSPRGHVILSGLIEKDKRFVLAPYLDQGLKLQRHIVRDGWLTLVLKKRSSF